jgi:Flp pilus assembly secretin CpaC
MESKAILGDLRQVKENPNVDNPLPEMYRTPAKRINVSDGVKLFYFTKHHSAVDLAANITELGFKVSHNASTNQLIIHCANDGDADKVLEYLANVDVPPIQVNIDCLILERFGDVTTDWETTLMVENILGEGVKLGGKTDSATGNLLPNFPGASLRETRRGEFGMDFGYWIDKGISGHQVRLIVDMLESRGYFKVLMNPTLETINGKPAEVSIIDKAPIQVTVTSKGAGTGQTDSYNLTRYEPVEDKLTVTPYVFADGFIGLKASIIVGAKTKPEGIVQNPILTKRIINVEENRIEPGKSLIIGGMRKSENRSVVRGVPFFKDLPIVGILFSSKDFEERATEVIFILTPSISSGGIPHAEMADFIREKHATPEYETGLTEFLSDPMGTDIYTDLVEEEAVKAEVERAKAEMHRITAERQALTEKLRADQAKRRVELLKEQAEAAKLQAEQAKKEAEAAVELEKTARQQAVAEAQRSAQAVTEKDQAVLDAQKAQAAADKAKADAAQALQKAQAEEQKAKQAAQEAQKAIEEAEKAKAEADKEETGTK